ncbi:MAG: hypothetical protein ABSH56_32780 [Bryobacteraceae bacterium]
MLAETEFPGILAMFVLHFVDNLGERTAGSFLRRPSQMTMRSVS